MSIRLRFTLLYNAILAVTLAVFGVTLYSIQSQTTYDAIKRNILRGSDTVGTALLHQVTNPSESVLPPHGGPQPFQSFSSDPTFRTLQEREIVRVLDSTGNLVASPYGLSNDALPLSESCMQSLIKQQECWASANVQDDQMLIYNRPIISGGRLVYILQVARSLTDRNTSLNVLGLTLVIASLVTLLIAFGIGWVLSRITLQPIQRITQTARAIGDERDFTQRVSYTGPQDDVGQLATTFNSMLARLQDAYQQVAYSLEMQRNFVADVSHELRTPLTTLRGNLDLLRRTPPIPADDRTDILKDSVDESDRLIRLVNDLLILARADARRNLAKEPVAILPVLEETCRQARLLAPERNITLEAADLSILGDHDILKQVLLIALDNALKHSSGNIVVSAAPSGEQVEIRVQDFGEGIAPDKLEHIFDRFYRGEESSTLGFGLGLSIAKSLVEGQGDTIKIESELGKGSTLILRFSC
jgi:two-component system OmpR family sensor kinase